MDHLNKMSALHDSDDSDFKEVSATSFNKISSAISKVGYSDGITHGRDSMFQVGFDRGYEDGLKTGFELTKWQAFSNVAKTFEDSNKALIDEATKFQLQNIPGAKNGVHFQMNVNSEESLREISKQQNEYIEGKIKHFNKNFELISKVFIK